jgi:hypothetical protein
MTADTSNARVERNKWKSVEAALACAAIITIIVIWTGGADDRERKAARDCDLIGATMLNGKPYKCSRLAPAQQGGSDNGH